MYIYVHLFVAFARRPKRPLFILFIQLTSWGLRALLAQQWHLTSAGA